MHKDIMIRGANAEVVARWLAGKLAEIQWESRLSPSEVFYTEKLEYLEPSPETWGYSIRVHGVIARSRPLNETLANRGLSLYSGSRHVPDAMRCEIRQGGDKRAQVVIDCESMINGHVQSEIIDQMSVMFDVVQVEGDQVGDIRPGGTQSLARFAQWVMTDTPQPAETPTGIPHEPFTLDFLIGKSPNEVAEQILFYSHDKQNEAIKRELKQENPVNQEYVLSRAYRSSTPQNKYLDHLGRSILPTGSVVLEFLVSHFYPAKDGKGVETAGRAWIYLFTHPRGTRLKAECEIDAVADDFRYLITKIQSMFEDLKVTHHSGQTQPAETSAGNARQDGKQNRGGRHPYPEDEWATNEIERGRPRGEVVKEWLEKTKTSGREFADFQDSFDKQTRAVKKRRENTARTE